MNNNAYERLELNRADRQRPADLPVVLEELLVAIDLARREGRPDDALVAEYLDLLECA